MKIKYLGTAASEGIPSPFCQCDTCKKSRLFGGKNLRSRSQALVNDEILIDFPADTLYHAHRFCINLFSIHNCLITHIHEDHFYPGELLNVNPEYITLPNNCSAIRFYGSEDVMIKGEKYFKKANGYVEFYAVRPFEPFRIENIIVTALPACHGTPHPYIYMLMEGKKAMLYAHDTDIFPKETWDYLNQTTPFFHLVSLDGNEGNQEDIPYQGHMCFGRNRICRQRMLKMGIVSEDTKFVLNHFSHNGKDVLYENLAAIALREKFDVSYDGMEIEF